MTRSVEVWLDADIAPAARVGTLHDDRGQIRFHYDREWLGGPHAFALDPDLSLDAQDEGRRKRTLYAWDYLLGVQDPTRQGALRFRETGSETFLAAERLAAPPLTSLSELESVARDLTSRRVDDLEQLRRWLAVLLAPGASLGGARPKVNFTDSDNTLWIGKFPSRDDTYDQGAWEYVMHELALRARIDVPPARIVRFSDHHTFCVRRFDRAPAGRRFYASAITLLRRVDSEDASYLELAQFLQNQGDPAGIDEDLEQLFRRVVFNVMAGHRDDHLRNHGFLLDSGGWRLAPAFDMTPHAQKDHHVLRLDDSDPHPSVATVLATHEFYRLTGARAGEITEEVAVVVDGWREAAQCHGLSRLELTEMEPAFSAHASYREGTERRPALRSPRGRRRP